MSARLDKALEALKALCAERPYAEVSLRDVAAKAEMPLADLYAEAPSKIALLDHLGRGFDAAALAAAETPAGDVHDRLFEAAMARIEAMEPWRGVLASIGGLDLAPLAARLPLAARAILEAAGVDATPPRLAAMSLAWARIVQVWRADQGALNRTMAEIDRALKLMRRRLGRVGQGF
jgi:AcrR family transcriptional regulator